MTVVTNNKTGGGAENNRDTLLALKRTKGPAIEDYGLAPAGSVELPSPAPGRPASQNIAAIRENVRDEWLLQAEIQKVGESISNPTMQDGPASKCSPTEEAGQEAKPKNKSNGLARAKGAIGTLAALGTTALVLAGLVRVLRRLANDAENGQNSE
jgi:hypothetical protein